MAYLSTSNFIHRHNYPKGYCCIFYGKSHIGGDICGDICDSLGMDKPD
jgi:hypothetical protein